MSLSNRAGGAVRSAHKAVQQQDTSVVTLFDFSDPGQTALWQPLNDVVMGGISTGIIKQHSSHSALFTGSLSLEKGGGFASVRTIPLSSNLSGLGGLLLNIRGDGKTYKLNLTDHRSPRDVLFQARFPTRRDEWMEMRIPFEKLSPTFRGRMLDGHPALDISSVRTFGLMIADRQAGPFALEIRRIVGCLSVSEDSSRQGSGDRG